MGAISEMDEYYNHPKVQQARRLLAEAEVDIRVELKAQEAAAICRCNHRRDRHAPSHSINYTGGHCKEKGCKCFNFLMQRI